MAYLGAGVLYVILSIKTSMGALSGIIGAGMNAVGTIAGGIMQRNAMKKVQDSIKEQQQENQNWYDRRYNEDATQRADAQRLLTMTEKSIKDRNRQAASTAAVMGGTDESVAAAKAANNQALADAASQIAASADARKDAIEQQYLATKSDLAGQQNALEQQKAAATKEAVMGVADAAGNVIPL